jgi:hypothetical protein
MYKGSQKMTATQSASNHRLCYDIVNILTPLAVLSTNGGKKKVTKVPLGAVIFAGWNVKVPLKATSTFCKVVSNESLGNMTQTYIHMSSSGGCGGGCGR